MSLEEEIARTLAEYLAADFEHGPFSDTAFVRAEVEADGMVSLFTSESESAWPAASFDAPQLAEWIALSPLLDRVRAEAAVQTLRALSDKYAGFTSEDPLQRLQFTSASAFMAAEAQAIEQNSEGNET